MLLSGVQRFAVMQLFDIVTPWIGWIEAALLCVVLMISALQPRSVLLSLQTLSSPIQRRYTSGSNGVIVFVLRAIYQLGTISLALLIAVSAYMGNGIPLMPHHYGLVMVVVVVIVLIKALVDKWIHLTIHFPINEVTYLKYRSELWQALSLLLWIYIFFSEWCNETIKWFIPCLMIGLYVIILWWKLMQVFGWTIEHICYTLLYMIHVEILPVLLMAGGIARILSLEFRV